MAFPPFLYSSGYTFFSLPFLGLSLLWRDVSDKRKPIIDKVLFYNGKKVQMENRDKVVPKWGSTGCLEMGF